MTGATPQPLWRYRHVRSRDDGTTLTELLVVCALLGVVLGAAWMLMDATREMSNYVEAKAQVSDETRVALDRITTEIRQAAEPTGREGSGVFSEIATGAVGFFSDIDGDAQLERVVYRRTGTKLTKSVTEPTIVDGVYTYGAEGPAKTMVSGLRPDWSDPIFTYWSRTSPPAQVAPADMALVSSVSIHIRNSATVGRRTAYSDLQTWVKVRSVFNSVS
ncbi:MAG TPA: hypothetical protein VF902_06955 [Coriobacteriia bacterium]